MNPKIANLKSRALYILLTLAFLWPITHLSAQTRKFFVDAISGNDQNDGSSPEKAFKSISRLNSLRLLGGEQLLFKGGQQFNGSLKLEGIHSDIKTPFIVSTFGSSRATILSGDSAAILAKDCIYLTISNLIIEGSGRLTGNRTNGIDFLEVKNGTIDNVKTSGYLYSGLQVTGGTDIRITNVNASNNGFCGINVLSSAKEYGPDGSAFKTVKRVYIGYSVAENNPGCPAITDNHSGNGILMGGVTNGLIEYCEAMNNGWDMPREGNGPVGIWAYMSDSIVIQHCYSHHNKTSPKGKDGGGFDFDGGITNSIMQYNLSAYNEGGGYGMFQYAGATEWSKNIVRYNISYNDGTKNGKCGIFMWCDPAATPMKQLKAYNNTVVNNQGFGVNFEPGNYLDFEFGNNIFVLTVPSDRFIGGQFSGALFDQNLYWTKLQNRPATMPETNPIYSDPQIKLPQNQQFKFKRIEEINSVGQFQLSSKSPAKKAGKPIENNGGKDYWRNPISLVGKPNIGAYGK
jgi:hypothetical protein